RLNELHLQKLDPSTSQRREFPTSFGCLNTPVSSSGGFASSRKGEGSSCWCDCSGEDANEACSQEQPDPYTTLPYFDTDSGIASVLGFNP
ncbi:Uncharacterized protein FKW44_023981, partial [Caligus rogercresseyi]